MLLTVCALLVLQAAAWPAGAETADKQASFVIDGNTGAVLHDQSGDEPRYPASLTKMMTLYMVFAEIEAGRMSSDTMLTVSANAASMAPSKMGLEAGERISLGNAIKAVVTKSANDMAVAIAEAIAGSEGEFARRMTKKARDIGMASSTFRNASGLPDPRQVTTARDMVTLGLRLRDDFPAHYGIFQLRSFSYGGKTYRSHNTLMNGFVGMDGIKTGYTRASGFNLVSSVQRDGKYVVGAVFGGVTASVRNAHMRMILFRALGSAGTEKTRKTAPVLIARQKAVKPPAPVQVASKAPTPPPAPRQAKSKDKPDAVAQAIAQAAAPAPAGDAQPDEPAIKIAKVRAVKVAGDTAPPAPAAAPQSPPPVVAEAPAPQRPQFTTASSVPRLLSRRAPPAAPAVDGDAAAEGQARKPGSLDAQVAALAPSAARPSALGLRPSATPDQPAPPKVAAGNAPAAAPAGGGYQIQVGAFASAGEAERHLDTVRGRANALLKDRRAMAQQAQVGNKQIYRARFAEFDSAAANAACTSLRQQKVDCMVLRSQ